MPCCIERLAGLTQRALVIEDTAEMRRREERLKGRLARPRSRRLVL